MSVASMTPEEFLREALKLSNGKGSRHSPFLDKTKLLISECDHSLWKSCEIIAKMEGWDKNRQSAYYRYCQRQGLKSKNK